MDSDGEYAHLCWKAEVVEQPPALLVKLKDTLSVVLSDGWSLIGLLSVICCWLTSCFARLRLRRKNMHPEKAFYPIAETQTGFFWLPKTRAFPGMILFFDFGFGFQIAGARRPC